ncbi:hypothetical protein GIB67_032500, partial [Kingdonia uniflora]
ATVDVVDCDKVYSVDVHLGRDSSRDGLKFEGKAFDSVVTVTFVIGTIRFTWFDFDREMDMPDGVCQETSSQAYDSATNGGVVYLGTYNASRTMNGKTFSGFHTNVQLSTLTSPRETSTQGDYQLSDGGAMHMGTDDGSRFINAQTCSTLHTNKLSTITILIPRKTSTKEYCHVSNGNSMHQGICDVSRIIKGQTGSGVHTNSDIALVIPRETNTQADDGGVIHLAIDNIFRTIDEITSSGVHTNPLSKFTNPRGTTQLDTNDAYSAANAKTDIESDS